jgi:tetratricopeptide (TPR) repeat protein
MARVYYVLGKYTKALDTTTECLAFQKRVLMIQSSQSEVSALSSRNNVTTSGLGTVRNLLKGGSVSFSAPAIPTVQHPIVMTNSTAKMLSHYPTHTCVAQTLLLRARVLAICGLYGEQSEDEEETIHSSGDVTLVHQAIQHVEMAVAMQRKISAATDVNLELTQWELATPMILLGVLKAEMHNFEEADGAYEEALLILRSVQQLHDEEKCAAAQRGDKESTMKHSKLLKRITKEMANVLYLRGRCYQCRRLYEDAFKCYNQSLGLLRSVGASKCDAATRRIMRCMKKSSALEKLLSVFWDDPCRV